jgi:hypothetical protein
MFLARANLITGTISGVSGRSCTFYSLGMQDHSAVDVRIIMIHTYRAVDLTAERSLIRMGEVSPSPAVAAAMPRGSDPNDMARPATVLLRGLSARYITGLSVAHFKSCQGLEQNCQLGAAFSPCRVGAALPISSSPRASVGRTPGLASILSMSPLLRRIV